MDTEQLLNFTCEIGRELIQNGGEIYRAEESMERILSAYGYTQTEVFAIPACIIINIQSDERNHVKSVRMKTSANNLHKLNRINALCRDICRDTPPVAENQAALQVILDTPRYPLALSYLAHGCAAGFFTLFWGGSTLDALVAFFCGLLVKLTLYHLQQVQANIFFTNLISSAALALIPLILGALGVGVNLDMVVIGAIMLLVPGIAITNVMRDVLSGDFLTAVSKLAEVLIVAASIAIGITIPISAFRLLGL